MKRLAAYLMILTLILALSPGCAEPPPEAGEDSSALGGPSSGLEPGGNQPALELFIASSGGISGTPTETIMNKYFSLIQEWSGGDLVLHYYPSASLGNDREIIEAVQLGSLSMMFGAPTAQGGLVPELALLDIPGLFNSIEACNSMLSGDFIEMIQSYYNAAGLQLLTCFSTGYRELSCNKPIASMADFQGLQIRTMENKYHVAYWQALGASPVPLTFNELYVALQRGVVEAQENPLHTFLGAGLGNVQEVLVKTRHLPFIHTYVMNKDLYDSISEEERQLLFRCFNGIRDESIQAMGDNEASMDQVCRETYGMEIIVPSAALLEEMRWANQPVIEMMQKDLSPRLVEEYVARAKALEEESS